jgi:hypothetical protein
MSLVYLCDFCKAEWAEPDHGDQRDPGPFMPKEWSTVQPRSGRVTHMGPLCAAKLTAAVEVINRNAKTSQTNVANQRT